MQPRIYTYKITFEEIPHWYWGVHKEKRYNDGYLGSPVTHKWMWEFYTPKIQILQLFSYSEEGWREAQQVEKKIIAPDLNKPHCLNEGLGPIVSLSGKRAGGKASWEKKTGVHDPDIRASTLKKVKEEGLGFYDPETQRKIHKGQKERETGIYDPDFYARLRQEGRGIFDPEAKEKSHLTMKDQGSGLWDSEVRKKGKKKSEASQKELKVGIYNPAVKERAMAAITLQVWESTIDGFRGRASSVALHNKANGWDKAAKIRIS